MTIIEALEKLNLPKPIAIIGAGLTGVSFAQLLNQANIEYTVFNESSTCHNYFDDKLNCVKVGQLNNPQLKKFKTLLVSPGVDLRRTCFDGLRSQAMLDMELFAKLFSHLVSVEHAPPKLIGVTGSNGKSTVAAMLHNVTTLTKENYVLCGNIGVPVLSALLTNQLNCKGYIIEISSYHLDNSPSLKLDIGVLLNITPDHLDRYNSYLDYAHSKSKVLSQAKIAIGNADDNEVCTFVNQHNKGILFTQKTISDKGIQWQFKSQQIFYLETLVADFSLYPLQGYQADNTMAVFAAAFALNIKANTVKKGCLTFKSLPCRFNLVGEKNGITFINDSKATNVGSVIAAVSSVKTPIILIAGGLAKDQDFTLLAKLGKEKIKQAVLIGADAQQLAEAFKQFKVDVVLAGNMILAVSIGINVAQQGDTVLLSPACASQDMFTNYLERGEVFEQAVKEYING